MEPDPRGPRLIFARSTARTLEAALARAIELESLARLYAIALSVGCPTILSDEEVLPIAERRKAYGGDIEVWISAPVAREKTKAPAKRSPRSKA